MLVRDQAKAVSTPRAADLLGLGERGKAFSGRFDFDDVALGSLVGQQPGLAAIDHRKKTAVRYACFSAARMSDENDAGPEPFANRAE